MDLIRLIIVPTFCMGIFTFGNLMAQNTKPENSMMFGDTSRIGLPFAKDPYVIWYKGKYLMYYSIPGISAPGKSTGWGIGIAESNDLKTWTRIGEVNTDPQAEYEQKGFAAPCALVLNNIVHLFYQTYGNGKNDAICHAWSNDGVIFMRDKTNPVFKPDGNWNCGRAIDAEVVFFRGKYYLYYATRDTNYKIQMLGVAEAPRNTDFKRKDWINVSKTAPLLKPELVWEKDCIEAASVIEHNGKLYMFYAGGYNNAPQQIGVTQSADGIHWERLFNSPFLANGNPGDWNSSESGHPHIFKNIDGTTWLFFQGNNDNGKTWFISNKQVFWKSNSPILKMF